MFNSKYDGPRVARVNKELEQGLKQIAEHESTLENREALSKLVGNEVIQVLVDADLACYPILEDEHGYGKHTRVERTIDGRNYFSERRRDWLERYGPQIIGGIIAIGGTVIGVLLGSWLSTVHPFG